MKILLTKAGSLTGTLFAARSPDNIPVVPGYLANKPPHYATAFQFEAVVRFADGATAWDTFAFNEVGFFSPPENDPTLAVALDNDLPPEITVETTIEPVKGPNVWLIHQTFFKATISDGLLIYLNEDGRPVHLNTNSFLDWVSDQKTTVNIKPF